MYCVGDTILYGPHGACKVSEITKRLFNGVPTDYYVLNPIRNETSTIYVPVNNQALARKMRKVLSAPEVYDFIQSMPQEDMIWIEDENQRKEVFHEMIVRGERSDLVRIIKGLYHHKQKLIAQGKKLHAADERFLKEAEKMLYEEFALVLQITPQQVLPFILEQIEPESK